MFSVQNSLSTFCYLSHGSRVDQQQRQRREREKLTNKSCDIWRDMEGGSNAGFEAAEANSLNEVKEMTLVVSRVNCCAYALLVTERRVK